MNLLLIGIRRNAIGGGVTVFKGFKPRKGGLVAGVRILSNLVRMSGSRGRPIVSSGGPMLSRGPSWSADSKLTLSTSITATEKSTYC